MIQSWIKDISPSAAKIIDHFEDVKEYGKSNPFVIDVSYNAAVFKPITINILGANLLRFTPNNGNPLSASINYSFNTYTYQEFLANTMNSPFEAGIMRIESNNANDFVAKRLSFNFTEFDPTGISTLKNIPLWRRLNQYTQTAIEIDITDYNITIDGDTLLQLPIVNGQNFKIYFYPSARASFKLLLGEGFLAKKNTLPPIPLTPNREIYYEPIYVKMKDNGSKIIV
jgi:hypothetical protein